MSSYTAPLKDMAFTINALANLPEIAQLPDFHDASPELVNAILEEAAKFAAEVVAPLNAIGDQQSSQIVGDTVRTPPGWQAAYRQYCAAGWSGMTEPTAWGGQGLPQAVGIAVQEMLASANTSFSLAPLLTSGAVHALCLCADEAIKQRYLEKMITGTWAGTMNLTEPQAGSDLSLVRTRAVPQEDGSFLVTGQKIFITYGEHDLSENIIHLVLARLPDAPPGVKGISLFLVPKLLVGADGSIGARNDVRCVSLEHKLGIHASPTCVMAFGDSGGATGYLLGEANRGLEYMFVMMNQARLGVGLQGVALAERAYQKALAYARERKQGRDAVTGAALVSIDHHPDVRRMLMSMKSRIDAYRALAYVTAGLLDRAQADTDPAARDTHRALAEFLIPIVKGCSTEMSVEVTSLGMQIHGGMGYIEETGAAQYWRDARITTIYEGTTGIQANDLVFRKLLRDRGATAQQLSAQISSTVQTLQADAALAPVGTALDAALTHWQAATQWMLTHARDATAGVLAAATPYLELAGIVCAGWQAGRAALAAKDTSDAAFCQAKRISALFYAAQQLPRAAALATTISLGECGMEGIGNTDNALF